MNAPSTYPLVYLPFSVSRALTAVPTLPEAPVWEPVPLRPLPPAIFLLDRFIWWLTLGLLAVVGYLFAKHAELLGLLSGSIISVTWVNLRRRARLRYQREEALYHDALSCQAAYPTALAHYQAAVVAFARVDAIPQYRQQRLAALLSATPLSFARIPAAELVPLQGRSEAFFVAYLQQHFEPSTIFTHCRVPVDDPRLGTDWYYPDVVYQDASGLCIDIEIDEPYALASREPIHCRGQDDARNAFFLRKNWVVVRFTEEQVVKQPLLCCQVLADVIFELNRRHYAARFYAERLVPYPQWEWGDARRLAKSRAREAYWNARLATESAR